MNCGQAELWLSILLRCSHSVFWRNVDENVMKFWRNSGEIMEERVKQQEAHKSHNSAFPQSELLSYACGGLTSVAFSRRGKKHARI